MHYVFAHNCSVQVQRRSIVRKGWLVLAQIWLQRQALDPNNSLVLIKIVPGLWHALFEHVVRHIRLKADEFRVYHGFRSDKNDCRKKKSNWRPPANNSYVCVCELYF